MQMMNVEERRTVAKPIEVLKDVPLDESNSEKFTRIGTSMEEKKKQDLIQFLKKSTNVFAWSHKDMLRINPSMITHRLNVSPSYKLPVKKGECSPQNETMPSKKKSRSW